MGIKVITEPASEPVTLSEIKLHLQIGSDATSSQIDRLRAAIVSPDQAVQTEAVGTNTRKPQRDMMAALSRSSATAEDTRLWSLITAARQYVEAATGRSLITRTLELVLDRFPRGPIALSRGPVQAVSSVVYRDPAGIEQTMDPATYLVDEIDGGVAALRYPWPSTAERFDAVRVRYVAGYGDAGDVPATYKQAMRLLVGHWFDQRSDVVIGATPAQIPHGVKRLLNQARIWKVS